MDRLPLAALVAGLLIVGGCRSPESAAPDGGQLLSGFDATREPAFTADTHFAAGQLAETQDQPARALEQYRQALSLDPQHRQSVYRLAVVLTQQRQFADAEQAWQRYIELTDGSAVAWSNYAYCLESAGRVSEAEAAYRSAVAADPGSEPARVNYGLMLARQRRWGEAREQLSAVLPPAAIAYNLASVCEQLAEPAMARGGYAEALQLRPDFLDARKRLNALGPGPTASLPTQ
jgi:tetratricopeptide (TPR) repeat protein